MCDDPIRADRLLREEADALLYGKGLLDLLGRYGTPRVTGSHTLRVMTWRDLDIYLEAEEISEASFFELGGRLAQALRPVRMSFRNERVAGTEGLPRGLYWGVYLGHERGSTWKIDIWAVGPDECAGLLAYCNSIAGRLTPETRRRILAIKSRFWKDPRYRRTVTSQDIYSAVLDDGIADVQGFEEYLERKGDASARR